MQVDFLIKREIVPTLLAISKTMASQRRSSTSMRDLSNSIQVIFKLLKESSSPSFWSGPRSSWFDWMSGRRPTFSVPFSVSEMPSFLSESVPSLSQEALESIRTQLYKIISNQPMIPLIGMKRMWKIHGFLIMLAQKMPISRDRILSDEVITRKDEAPISTGHVFALSEIIDLLHRSKHINPYSNLPLLDIDVCHLIQLAINYHRKADPPDLKVTEFLISLRNPKKVAYTNQLIFLLDDKDCPYQIYLLRLNTSLSWEEKKKMNAKIDVVKSSGNIRRALYEGLISMRHIERIPDDGLKLLNVFDKTLDLLRGRWRDQFLKALENATTEDVFSDYINCEEPLIKQVCNGQTNKTINRNSPGNG